MRRNQFNDFKTPKGESETSIYSKQMYCSQTEAHDKYDIEFHPQINFIDAFDRPQRPTSSPTKLKMSTPEKMKFKAKIFAEDEASREVCQ